MSEQIRLFDIIQAWVAENYPNLVVDDFKPDEIEPQIRINLLGRKTASNDSVAVVYENINVVYYAAPNYIHYWSWCEVNPSRQDYFDVLKLAIDRGLANMKPRSQSRPQPS